MSRFVNKLPEWMQPPVKLVVETFVRFDQDQVPRLAAAMSYFLLLAVAPLLLILNAVLSVAGARLGFGAAPPLGDASTTAASGIAQAVSWAGSYAPYLAVALVIVAGLSVFGQFVGALEVIWGTPPHRTPVGAFFRSHALSLALLVVSALVLLAVLMLSAVVTVFAGIVLQLAQESGLRLSGIWLSVALRVGPVWLASAVLLSLIHI